MKLLLLNQYYLEENDSGISRINEITVIAGMIHANKTEKRSEYKGKFFVHKQHKKISV